MAGPSPLRASASSEATPKKSQFTSLASLMETSPNNNNNNNKGRLSHGESGQARPDRRQLNVVAEGSRSRSRDRRDNAKDEGGGEKKKGRLSAWKMMALTVSMGGSQVSPLSQIPGYYVLIIQDSLDSVCSAVYGVWVYTEEIESLATEPHIYYRSVCRSSLHPLSGLPDLSLD